MDIIKFYQKKLKNVMNTIITVNFVYGAPMAHNPILRRSEFDVGVMVFLVEHSGLEPLTFWLPAKRSPN